MPTEKIRLRIGELAKAVLVTGQAYQDPKDALNEFVSNAADEYSEAGLRGGQIRIMLRRRGRYPMLAIEDSGRGMDAARLRAIAGSLFDSTKAGRLADTGREGDRDPRVSAARRALRHHHLPRGSTTTLTLRLERGRATAELVSNERRRARSQPGTAVYIPRSRS